MIIKLKCLISNGLTLPTLVFYIGINIFVINQLIFSAGRWAWDLASLVMT